jgi:hypothetical protein
MVVVQVAVMEVVVGVQILLMVLMVPMLSLIASILHL